MRRIGAVVLLGAAVLGTVGCGSPRYQYEKVDEVRLYYRVPRDWTVFDLTQQARDEDDPVSGRTTLRRVVIDSADQASADHMKDLAAERIVGRLDVVVLTREVADNTSLTDIRRSLAGLGFDPVAPPEEISLSGNFSLFAEAPRFLADGSQGTILAYAARFDPPEDNSSELVTRQFIDLSFVNPIARTAYLMTFQCRLDCTQEEVDEAIDIMNSITIGRR